MLPIDNQRFLQVISTREIMSEDEVLQEIITIFGQDCSEDAINDINSQINRFNLAIKSVVCEFTGSKYWVFTSPVIDESMTFLGEFTQSQIEFAHKVFSEIIHSEERHLSTISCINLGFQIDPKIPLTEAERLVNLLVEGMWLKNLEGELYIGVRSIGCLMPIFNNCYAEALKACPVCNRTVFHGYECDKCNVVSHLYCLATALHYRKGTLKCMNCRAKLQISAEDLPQIVANETGETSGNNVRPMFEGFRKSQRT